MFASIQESFSVTSSGVIESRTVDNLRSGRSFRFFRGVLFGSSPQRQSELLYAYYMPSHTYFSCCLLFPVIDRQILSFVIEIILETVV